MGMEDAVRARDLLEGGPQDAVIQGMIRKSVKRFSEKIMPKQEAKAFTRQRREEMAGNQV
jgi:hypothetical protein